MKILSVAEFDPAQVLTRHRAALRAAGVDYRLALHYRYYESDVCDWEASSFDSDGAESLRAFAEEADVIQFHPGIGQPWSYLSLDLRLRGDGDELPFGTGHGVNAGPRIDWTSVGLRARRIAFFHGSKNAAANARLYAGEYRKRGMALWTSTLDYAAWMGATFIPSIVEVEGRAPLREPDDPLVVVHTPTDPSNCHTDEYTQLVRQLGVVSVFKHQRPHAEVLRAKKQAHVGFDHLRGAFSVNTLENSALGLVPLVGLRDEMRRRWPEELGPRPPWPRIESVADLEIWLRKLRDELNMTREHQERAFAWSQQVWNPGNLGAYILRRYEEVLR